MSSRTEKFAYRVELDGKSAAESLEFLKKKSGDLRAEMKRLKDANDLAGFEAVERQAKSVTREMKRYELAVFDVQKVMNNLSGVMRRDLFQAQKALQRQMNDELVPGTKEYEAALKDLAAVQKRIIELSKEQRAAGKDTQQPEKLNTMFSRVADAVNKYALVVGGALFGLSALKDKAEEAVDSFNKFEQAKAELQSLTGVSKDATDAIGDFAVELSTSVVAGGVRITSSATDIVDAFKLVGSQAPELLKDSIALQQVTKDALILAEASGGEVNDNVKGLTTTLNMFDLVSQDTNKTIRESHRIINVLAAGAQAGAGEIPYIQEAMEKAGTQAHMFGISLENTVGIIETLAPRISEASMAGTGLRGVLLDLEKQTNGNFKPSVVGYRQAMENLAAAHLTTAQLVKLVGNEQATALTIMIQHRDETVKYTQAVTNSNKAIEQASINTDTNTAKLEQAKNIAEKQRIELGEKLAPAMLQIAHANNIVTRSFIALINSFNIGETSITKATDAYKDHTEKLQKLETDMIPLIRRYEELQNKTSLNKNEQEELKRIINEISKAMPDAVSAYGSLGGAMDIDSEKAKQLLEHMRRVKEIMNDKVIKETEKERNAVMVEQLQLGRRIQEQRKNWPKTLATLEDEADKLKGTKYYEDAQKRITREKENLLQMQDNWDALNDKVKSYNAAISELKGTAPPPSEAGSTKSSSGISGGIQTESERKASEAATKKAEDEAKKALSELEAARDRLRNINIQIQTSLKEGIDKEVFNIYQRYQKEIDVATEKEKEKTDLSQDWGKVRQALELARQEETNNAITKFEKDAEAKQAEKIKTDAQKRKDEHDNIMAFLDGGYAKELNALKLAEQKKTISHEEYLLAVQNLDEKYAIKAEAKRKKWADKTAKEQKAELERGIQAEMQVTSALASFTASLQDNELARAGQNEEKKKQINKKYADIDLAITSAKIIAATALAIIQAFPNPLLMGAAAITGGIEEATAIAQRNRVRGFEDGYYNVTRTDGMQYRAGVSGDTSTQMVNKPTVFLAGEGGKMFPEMIIDGQTMRNMQINYPEAINAIHASRSMPGFANGSYGSSSTVVNNNTVREVVNAQMVGVIKQLEETLKKGIKAKLIYRDLTEFNSKVEQQKTDFN